MWESATLAAVPGLRMLTPRDLCHRDPYGWQEDPRLHIRQGNGDIESHPLCSTVMNPVRERCENRSSLTQNIGSVADDTSSTQHSTLLSSDAKRETPFGQSNVSRCYPVNKGIYRSETAALFQILAVTIQSREPKKDT